MKTRQTWITGAGLALALAVAPGAWANDPTNTAESLKSAPDDSGRNQRDRQDAAVTPMDQSNDPADIELTQKIRKAVVADDGLSMNAHNVKIITLGGLVTLRGPVESPAEKAKIVQIAAQHAGGANKVKDELEVAP